MKLNIDIDFENYQVEEIDNKFSFTKLLKEAFSKLEDTHKKKDGYLSISQFTGNACLRKCYYQLMKVQRSKNTFEKDWIFKVGHSIHDLIQSTMEQQKFLMGVEQYFEDHELKICGSTDGYFIDHSKKEIRMLDIKSAGLNTFEYVSKSNRAKVDHIAQLHVYAYLLKKHFYPDYEIKSMHILYVNKNQADFKPNLDDLLNKYEKMYHDYSEMVKENCVPFVLEDVEQDRLDFHNIVKQKSEVNKDYQLKECVFNYSEEIIQKELDKLEDFWNRIENNKLPNKISKFLYCKNCEYVLECRSQDWLDEQLKK